MCITKLLSLQLRFIFEYELVSIVTMDCNTKGKVSDAGPLLFDRLKCGSMFAFSMLRHPTGNDVELSAARMKFMSLRFFSLWSLRPRAGIAVNLVARYAPDRGCSVVCCIRWRRYFCQVR